MDSNTSPLAHFVATATEFQSPSHPPPFSDPPSQSNSPQHSPSSRGRELIPDNQPCRHAATAAAGLGSLGGAFRSVIPSRLSSSRPGSMSPPLSPAAPPATTQATAYPLPTGFSCTSRLGPTPATTTQSASATNSTPLSSRPSTPARLATDDPVLLSTLATADQASILVVVVEEDEPDTRADALSCKLGAIDLNASASRSAPKRVGGKGGRIYGGSQSGEIHVWHLDTMSLLARLEGHTGAVLALELVTEPDRPWLISSSGDGTVRVSQLSPPFQPRDPVRFECPNSSLFLFFWCLGVAHALADRTVLDPTSARQRGRHLLSRVGAMASARRGRRINRSPTQSNHQSSRPQAPGGKDLCWLPGYLHHGTHPSCHPRPCTWLTCSLLVS